jgi:hypothetical protein
MALRPRFAKIKGQENGNQSEYYECTKLIFCSRQILMSHIIGISINCDISKLVAVVKGGNYGYLL